MINQDIIAQDLFYKIRSRFPKMEMGDENGAPTFEATKGRFFDFDAIFEGVNLGTVSISINEPGSLKIYFNRNILEDADSIVSGTWYNFLKEMRKFAMKRLMSFDTRDIAKTNLDKRDYGYLAKKESVMSESIMKGTSRTSYKPLDKTRLIIRHSKTVDESIPGARSRNIESLFIENAQGERFKYPFPHKAGAEAMQRHVANGGVPHDPVGQKIIGMSEDIAKLSSFKRYVTREDLMNAGTNDIVARANDKLQSLKEMIQRLSRQHHYEEFKKNCAMGAGDSPLIDEVTMEEYKDKFTVKSFKEDIADVFPLLYRIMQETSDIDLDSIAQVEETYGEIDLDTVVYESPEAQFESWASTLVETQLSPEELSKLQELVSEHFPVGINGENVSSTLQSLGINISEEAKVKLATLAETDGPDADAKNVVVEYLAQYEPEILSAIGISGNTTAPEPVGAQPQGEEGMMRESGDQTPEEKRHAMEYLNKVARAIRAGEVQPEEVEQEFFNTLPMLGVSDEKTYAAWDRITGETKPAARPAMSDADIDAELRGVKGGEDDEDSTFLNKLRGQAKSGSISQDNTGFGSDVDEAKEETKSSSKQIAEFILGFYDRETGNFPLGETGVAIKVTKEFGDQAGELAKRLIEKLSCKQDPADAEMAEMMRFNSRINGISEAKKAKPDFLDMDKDGDKKEPMKKAVADKKKTIKESADFADMLVLSGLRK